MSVVPSEGVDLASNHVSMGHSERLLTDGDALNKVMRDFERARVWHESFSEEVDRRHKAYRGILDRRADAARWTSKLHPPVLYDVVQKIVSNLVEDQMKFRVTPRIRYAEAAEIDRTLKAARSIDALLSYSMQQDHFDEKQMDFALQASVAGITVGKVSWNFQEKMIPSREAVTHYVYGDEAENIGPFPVLGWQDVTKPTVIHDDPTFQVVDVRDFMWDEAATSLDDARWVCHRTWMTIEQLREMEKIGVYRDIDDIDADEDGDNEKSWSLSSREDELFKTNRTKGRIEVLEYWTDDYVLTVADRNVLIRNEPNPFWHKQKPFVVASTMPEPFSMRGVSEVEVVEHLQNALWTMMNQRVDNVTLLNNMIVVFRADVEDPDDFEWAPGEKWVLDDIAQVQQLKVDPTVGTITLQAEALIKADIQNLSGGLPMLGGTESIDQGTATAVSIFTSIAQRRVAVKKQQLMYAYQRAAQMEVKLLQQFITEKRVVPIIGHGGFSSLMEVEPGQLDGDFYCEIKPMGESLLRQEKRAEAQAKMTLFESIAPVFKAMGQELNPEPWLRDYLEAYDVTNIEEYMTPPPKPPAPPVPPPGAPPFDTGGQNGAGTPPNAENAIPPVGVQPGGTTNADAAAGPQAPSNAGSMSPVAALQRFASGSGDGRNS